MAIEGEAYTDKAFFKERYRQLKQLGTPHLSKRSTTVKDEDSGKWQTVWIVEYEVEDVKSPLVN